MRLISIGGIGPRAIQLLLICFTLAAANLEPLRQLTQDKRFFVLRRELQQFAAGASETLFYRGVVACRFGRENDALQRSRSSWPYIRLRKLPTRHSRNSSRPGCD